VDEGREKSNEKKKGQRETDDGTTTKSRAGLERRGDGAGKGGRGGRKKRRARGEGGEKREKKKESIEIRGWTKKKGKGGGRGGRERGSAAAQPT